MDKRIEQQEYLKNRDKIITTRAIAESRVLDISSIDPRIIEKYDLRPGQITPLTGTLLINSFFIGYGYENLQE